LSEVVARFSPASAWAITLNAEEIVLCFLILLLLLRPGKTSRQLVLALGLTLALA